MILHCIPKSIKNLYGAGNWKDITALSLVLEELEKPVANVYFDEGSSGENVLQSVSDETTDMIVHYSLWISLFNALRRKHPRLRIHIRAHNAEAFQHYHRSNPDLSLSADNLRKIYGIGNLVLQDWWCRRESNTIMGISQWDIEHYWGLFPGKSRMVYLPYFSPWPYVRPQVSPMEWRSRDNVIACLAASRDRISRAMVEGFSRLIEVLSQNQKREVFRFWVSRGVRDDGDLHGVDDERFVSEYLQEPWDFLCSIRAVALLSPLGFGTKTTIYDGLAAGCHVLIDPGLASRLPLEVCQRCIVVDPQKGENVDQLLAALEAPPIKDNLNEILHRQSTREVSRILNGAVSPQSDSPQISFSGTNGNETQFKL